MDGIDVGKMKEELKWVQIREEESQSVFGKLKSKGISGFLVPAGCLVTTGILLSGLYQMTRKNNQMQQVLMRYRVGAQGVTIIIAMISLLAVPLTKSE